MDYSCEAVCLEEHCTVSACHLKTQFLQTGITIYSLQSKVKLIKQTHTHTHTFNGPLSETTRVSRYQKGKTNLDFTEARESEWQWNPLGHMQVCTSLQTDNHASTPPLSFLQARCPTISVKVLKAKKLIKQKNKRTKSLSLSRL